MVEAKPNIATPMISGLILSPHQGELFYDSYLYRSVMGVPYNIPLLLILKSLLVLTKFASLCTLRLFYIGKW